MIHSSDFAQLSWICVIIGSQGSRLSLSLGIGRCSSRSLSLSHPAFSCLSCCLLFFVHICDLFFISPSLRHPMEPMAKNHSVQAR